MKLCTNFFEMQLPAGSELVSSTDPADTNEDSIVLKLKNFGMVTIEAFYFNDSDAPFKQVWDSLANDAQSIGAQLTNKNADSSEFSMESISGSEPFIHHHLLIQQKEFVFDSNFFKNYNPEDAIDVKIMMESIVVLDAPQEYSELIIGKRMPMIQAQLIN